MQQNIKARFNTISFSIIAILCALFPFFFLPATLGGIGAVKGVFLYAGVFVAISLWLVGQFVDGTLTVPKHRALLALAAWVVLGFVGALLSANSSVSLWGRGFATDSFATMLVLALFAFIVATFARDQRKLVKLFLAAFAGSVLTVLLQVILYLSQNVGFIAHYLPHVANNGTLVGSWVDFAHFVTITFVLSLLMFEVLMPKGFFKFLSLFSMILSLIVLAFLNFKVSWIVASVSALLVFVYKSSVERSISKILPVAAQEYETTAEAPQQRFPVMSFAALLVGLFFLLSANSVGSALAARAGVSFNDIRPSIGSSTHVMRATLAKDPIFGAGQGRYVDVWNLYHQQGVNQSIFWNTSFENAFGWVATSFTTDGIITTVMFLIALVLVIIHGFKLFNYQYPDRFSRFIAVASLIMLIAFLALILFANPGIVLITIGCMYIGFLIGVSTLVGKTQLVSLNYLKDPRTSFFAILILVVAVMAGFTATYSTGNRFASIVQYNRALGATELASASQRLDSAIMLSPNDVYYRTRAALYINEFSKATAAQTPDKASLQADFTQAEQSARAAVAWDPTSANNWLVLSQVYELVASDTNADATKNATDASVEAQKRNPVNPLYVLNKAQVALASKDTAGALGYIAEALTLKPDYLDAFVLRANIKQAGGDTQAAKNEITAYLKVAPFDDQGYALLGQAEMQLKDYQAALEAFAQAKAIAPTNANYYLAYINTLQSMGNKTQAVEELKKFKTLFPNVTGVDEQIEAFQKQATTPPPADTSDKTTKKN